MRSSLLAFALSCLLTAPLGAQTSYPMITHTLPTAVQRGKTTEVQVFGQQNFFGTYQALFQGTGLKAEGLTLPPKGAPLTTVTNVKFKVAVEANAPLGVREFRLASTLGLSSVGQLLIVADPVIEEKGPNEELDKAPAVPVPCVVSGRIEAVEDVDYYAFTVAAGETLTFEVLGARLQDKIHDLQKHADPMLTLFDRTGRELSANDDCYFADPLLTYTFKEAGTYVVQVRDSKFDNDQRWVYALSVTNKPYAAQLFPMAGNPGQKVQVEPVGSARLLADRVTITAPATPGLHTLALDIKGSQSPPTAFYVSKLPQVLEAGTFGNPKAAQRVTLPCGINGRISQPRELDHFVCTGSKGQTLRLEMFARRFGTLWQSALDGVLEVMSLDGKVLASSDDVNGKDPALYYTPLSDGDFVVRIRDLNSKGSASAVYYVEIEPAVPDFTLKCDPDKAMIGPGSSAPIYVQLNRLNGFTGAVAVQIKGLPKGITATPLTIDPAMKEGVIVLTADSNAGLSAGAIEIVGTGSYKGADGKDIVLTRTATAQQEIYLPGGGRGRFDIDMPAVAVTQQSDILKVNVTPTRLKVKPGDEVKIDITIERRPDYTKSVSLDVILRHLGSVYANPLPASVTMVEGKSKTLLNSESKGHIVLKIAPTATPIADVPICVLTHVSINFVVKVSYASAPILLTIEK